jgi:hypothetical protein
MARRIYQCAASCRQTSINIITGTVCNNDQHFSDVSSKALTQIVKNGITGCRMQTVSNINVLFSTKQQQIQDRQETNPVFEISALEFRI